MADSRISRRLFVRDATAAAAAAGLAPAVAAPAGDPTPADPRDIRSYHADMEYRRCGRTGWMLSAVGLGGHWKKLNRLLPGVYRGASWLGVDLRDPRFQRNRHDVVTRAIERGINYVDACTSQEVLAYAQALRGRREQMYFGYSWYQHEPRAPDWRSFPRLKESLAAGLKQAGLEYVDLWRIILCEASSRHTPQEIEACLQALHWAKQEGLARAAGIATHDRTHLKNLVETAADTLDVVVAPYTAHSRLLQDDHGLWAALAQHHVGWLGVKPFANGVLFSGDGIPGDPHFPDDCRLARLALRYVLCNPALTSTVAGLLCAEQVDNAALAVKERRELDLQEQADLQRNLQRAWAGMPFHYRWLKDWDYV